MYDFLIVEIGSTITLVNVFNFDIGLIGQGVHPTTVEDVTIGVNGAIEDFQNLYKVNDFKYKEMFATSSAAGGLRMTVHGLVYDMTVKAAKEAALGAGANIHFITAGKLKPFDLEKINKINPNIILLAGGVDYGERETALYNAEMIKNLSLDVPIIYAGNLENTEEIKCILKDVTCVDNVYPKIDNLNVEPTRKVIHKVFEDNIIHAKGMDNIKTLTDSIIPTPGAVMECAKLLASKMGDLIVIDVGGATTDIHSVTSYINDNVITPEPNAKRTVEGDLGVYVNKDNLVELTDLSGFSNLDYLLKNYSPIPKSNDEFELVSKLTYTAVKESLNRHAGEYKEFYTSSGVKKLVEGKDLTDVKYIVLTGGALVNLNGKKIVTEVLKENTKKLLPINAKILVDSKYIMASLGALSKKYPEVAFRLLKGSLV
ncbi:glutamate mutase L [Mycoplasmatota bacterium]|nr:glutamate mutase L [Mycoplasmatota bacterium]